MVCVINLLLYMVLCTSIKSQLVAPTTNKTSICYRYRCPIGKNCQVINGKPICKCNHYCIKAAETGPVCAQNGQTYNDLCHLKKEECKRGKYIVVKHYGNCSKAAPCYDRERETRLGLCRDWAKFGACSKHKDLMAKYCTKTCGMCNSTSLAVEPCKTSQYGCCKNSMLPALGPNYKGCYRGCRDGIHCKFFPNFCGDKLNVNTMRKYCPYTCRYCVPKNGISIAILTDKNLNS